MAYTAGLAAIQVGAVAGGYAAGYYFEKRGRSKTLPEGHLPKYGNHACIVLGYIVALLLCIWAFFSPPRPSDAKGLIVLILCAGVLLGGVAYLLFAYSETLYAPPPEGKTSKPKRIKKSAPDTEPDKWAALDEYLDGIAASGNYTFRHAPYAGWNTMIMDKDGALLRLVSMIYSWPTGIEVTSEYQIEVSRIIRVDLLNYESKEARYNTITEGKSSRDGVLVRATIGGLLFGPAGAVVGAMSAGSSNTAASVTTVGESVRYEGSELVISVSDIAHPVIRFLSRNQSESETWLYRIRAAMAKYSQKADI